MWTTTCGATAALALLLAGCGNRSAEPAAREEALLDEGAQDEAGADPRGAAPVEPGALAAAWARVTVVDHSARADQDGDGFPAEDDPDDDNPYAFPGAAEIPCNDLDEDGDEVDSCPADEDGDGVRADLDCDDLDASRSQLLADVTCNGGDENCNGHDDCDSDQDGAMDWYDLDPADPEVSVPERRGEVDHDSP